jgi:hypothetical protein
MPPGYGPRAHREWECLVVLELLFTIGEKLSLRIGRLHGDILIQGKNTTF